MPPAFLRPAEYDAFPLLKDGPGSETRRLALVSESGRATITYSPQGNFFLLEELNRRFRKLDAAGKEVFAVEWAADLANPAFSHLLVGPSGLYDLSKEPVAKEAFSQVLNAEAERRFTERYWRKVFEELYAQAETVVYGEAFSADTRRLPVYFRTGAAWILLYASPEQVEIDRDPYGLGTRIEGYPPKFDRMLLLKDLRRGTFSHHSHEVRGDVLPAGFSQRDLFELPEHDLSYRQDVSLETLFFRKQGVLDEIVYTGIPVSLYGRADHRLRIGAETLSFWELAVRPVFSPLETNISVFVLPEAYAAGSDLVFLEFRPLSNIETAGSDGLYVLKRKPDRGG